MDILIAKINEGLERFNDYCGKPHSIHLSIDRYFDLTKIDWKHLNLAEFTYRGLYFISSESPKTPSVKVYIGANLAESSAVSAGITHCLPKENWNAGKGYFDDELRVYFTRVYTLPLKDIGDIQRAKALRNYLKDYLHEELIDRSKITIKKAPVTYTQHTSNQQIDECKSCHQTIPCEELPAAQKNGGLCHYCAHLYEKEDLMNP